MPTEKHRKVTIAEGRHPITGFTSVTDEAAREAINVGLDVAGNPGVDGVIRQTAGTRPGYYIAIATGAGADKWQFIGSDPPASPTVAGVIEIATQGEVDAGTDTERAVTPGTLATRLTAAITGLFDFKGSTDCSTNPTYPTASKGDAYRVSVAGKIGGASGVSLDVGDFFIAIADNAGGTQAAVGTSWEQWEHNGNYQPLDTDLTALAAIAGVQGDVIYRNATEWTRLPAGTSGYFLKTNGAAANPSWAATAGGPALYNTYGAPTPILNRITTQPLAAYHHFYLLKAAYGGSALIRVRRASDNAELDISNVGAILDVDALANHCGASDGFLVTAYDQTGGGLTVTQATAANQPKIWNGASKDFAAYSQATANGYNAYLGTAGSAVPAVFFDGTNDMLARTDAYGLTANPALSVAWIEREATRGAHWSIGDSAQGNGKYLQPYVAAGPVNTQLKIGANSMERIFTVTNVTAQQNRYVATKALNANCSAIVLRQNGAVAAQAGVTSGTVTLDNEAFVIGGDTSLAFPLGATMPMLPMPFNADLSAQAADLATLEAWMQDAHYTAT